MKILVINGPNLNMLGKRDPAKYGNLNLKEINKGLTLIADQSDCHLIFFQSNYEGEIIDFLQKDSSRKTDGILINPGALIRYGYSLRQALIDLDKPVVEIHMSNIKKTGINTMTNVLDDVQIDQVIGLQEKSYFLGLSKLIIYLNNLNK